MCNTIVMIICHTPQVYIATPKISKHHFDSKIPQSIVMHCTIIRSVMDTLTSGTDICVVCLSSNNHIQC